MSAQKRVSHCIYSDYVEYSKVHYITVYLNILIWMSYLQVFPLMNNCVNSYFCMDLLLELQLLCQRVSACCFVLIFSF